MQKIFTKYMCIVMGIALLAILLLNYQLQSKNAQERMIENSRLKLEQVSQSITSNQQELENLTASLEEDYLTRARAFAYIIEQNPKAIESQEELERIKELLNVDELHVINEKGILFAGTIPKYFDMDFRSTKQTIEFLQILEDPDGFLVQDIQPNGAEQKIFQYVGVARRDMPGIAQVGFEPRRLLDAQKRNELPYIFSHLPVDAGSSIFAIDADTGEILADTNATMEGKKIADLGLEADYATRYAEGEFYILEGSNKFYLMEQYDNLILGVSQQEESLYAERWDQLAFSLLYLLPTFLLMILLINYLLKRQIVNGIHGIMAELGHITDGNLETVVTVENNPEFKQLSTGINQMVGSILEATVKISRIIEVVNVPIGIFEFHKDIDSVMATNRLRYVMMLTEEEAERLYQDKQLFVERLHTLMTDREDEDIYKISTLPPKWVKIHMFSDLTDTFGVIIDVTQDILERRKIKRERDYDPLTKLCNLSKFKQIVRDMLAQPELKQISALLMLDLDRFKNVNDQYGHDWGDNYLKIAASFLKELAPEQSVVARRSGDEFCLFLYGFDSRDEILRLVSDFYLKVEREKIIFPDATEKSLQISAGIAWYGEELNNYEVLMHAADVALYEAKNSGRGTYRQFDDRNTY